MSPRAATAAITPAPQATANESAAEWVPIDAIHPWKDNPRKNDKIVPELVRSLKRFGFGAPILARKANGEIIAGHTRYKAAKKLGLDRVPVRFLDLDPAEAHVLALADNKLGEESEWDTEMLASVLGTIGSDVDLLVGTGFDQDEIDKLIRPPVEAEDSGDSKLGGLQYRILVECDGEDHQAHVLGDLESQGLKCKPIIS